MSDQGDFSGCFDAVPGALCLITADVEECIVYANKEMLDLYRCADIAAFARHTGGRFLGMVADEAPMPLSCYASAAGIESGDYCYVSFTLRDAEGHFVQVEGSAKRVRIEGGSYWSLLIADMRKRRAGLEGDDVTGLMGVHEFYEKSGVLAERDVARGAYGTRYPIYFNVANFKAYNSLHGIESGDACLRTIANELCVRFPEAMVAHLAADSFVVLEPSGTDLFKRIEDACAAIDAVLDNPRIRAKAGVFVADTPALLGVPAADTVDFAKVACDTIKRNADVCYTVYTEEMGRQIEVRAQVLEHFDTALQDGSIKVFVQPLVRAITGKVCGVEALARWDTPAGVRLSPDDFIPVLEDARLIHKLDLHVVDSAMRFIRAEIDAGHEVVPVSINMSRVDFSLVDAFEAVDRAATAFQIPRDYVRIEVTETAILESDTAVRDAIARFRAHGYQVWIDDFGSGVSSLNVLKDYPVDGLKIDLLFLRNFNERARIIVTSIVRMAKGLGMHTIAEGVETQEQADFLRSIGCEIMQGYLFGKPTIATAFLARCRRLGMRAEGRFETQLLERAGLVDLATDEPVAVVRLSGERMEILCGNRAYRDVIASAGSATIETTNRVLASHDYALREKLLAFARKTAAGTSETTMTYVDGGQYLRINARLIGNVGETSLMRVVLHNITHDEDGGASRRFDEMLRSLVLTYDGIYYLHVDTDEVEVIETMEAGLAADARIPGIERTFEALARRAIHADDLDRFLGFASIDNLHALARDSRRCEATNLFRARRDGGSYHWMVFDAIVLTRTPSRDILLCVRDEVMERQRDVSSLLPTFASSFGVTLNAGDSEGDLRASLWQSFVDFNKNPVFWKDCDHRFVGANRAFLDAFGLGSIEDIRGKTDADLGWNANLSKVHDDERMVLEKGTPIRDATVSCVMHGQLRTLVGSKYPVFEGGRIVGLEGTFRTLGEFKARKDSDERTLLSNDESGLPGFRSLIMTGLGYADSLRLCGEDYAMVLIDVPEFNRVCASYGDVFRRDLFDRIYRYVRGICSLGGALAHIGSCCFAYLEKGTDTADLRSRILAAANGVHAIAEVNGCPCTLFPQYAIGLGSESRSFDGLIRLLFERLNESEEESYGRELYLGERILFDREKFDTLPDPVALWDPDTFELLYMNAAYLRDLHLSEHFAYQGQPCYKIVEGLDEPCSFCKRGRLRRDRFEWETRHNRVSGKDYLACATLVPWQGKDCAFMLGLNLEPFVKNDIDRNEYLFREAAANDAIAVGIQETDPNEGIRKFIANVGRTLSAERFYVFEEAGDGTVGATFEWKRDAGAPALRPELTGIPCSHVRALADELKEDPVTLIEDADAFRRAHPDFALPIEGVKSVASGSLHLTGGRLGFSFVINPAPETFHTVNLLLTTLTRFLEVLLRNRDIVEHLKQLSTTDQLTGMMNRRALIDYLGALPAGRAIAVVFGDINGLKRVNDERGHRAGDEMIASVAQTMSAIVGCDHVFRMGGDEFLMVVENAEGRDLDALMDELHRGFARHGASVALGSARYTTPLSNIDAVISKVDRLMYADKGAHYRGRRSEDRV